MSLTAIYNLSVLFIESQKFFFLKNLKTRKTLITVKVYGSRPFFPSNIVIIGYSNFSTDDKAASKKTFFQYSVYFNKQQEKIPKTYFSINYLKSLTDKFFYFFWELVKFPADNVENIIEQLRCLKAKSSKSVFIFFTLMFIYLFWIKARVIYFTNNWIYTTNHKRIAVNYFWFVILSGIVGMVLATIIRLEFAYPGVGVLAGDSIQYLSLASAHGVIMVFFMIMPLLFGAFANFLLPTQLGVHDVAFPRLNSAAFWFLPGGLLMLCQLVCVDRRYQRMNCFNIREVQSLLKRKFFVDLINSKDQRNLLDISAIGLRFKSENFASANSNTINFYFYGLDLDFKSRFSLYNFKTTELDLSCAVKFNQKSYFYNNINYFYRSNFFNFFNSFIFFVTDRSSSFSLIAKIYSLASFIFFKIFFLFNRTYLYIKFLFSLVTHSLFSAFSYIYTIINDFFYYVARAIIIFFYAVGRSYRRVRSFFLTDLFEHLDYTSATILWRFDVFIKIIEQKQKKFDIFMKSSGLTTLLNKLYSLLFVNEFISLFLSIFSFFKIFFFLDIYRFSVYLPFSDSNFFINLWSVIALSLNNWIAFITFAHLTSKKSFEIYLSDAAYNKYLLTQQRTLKSFLVSTGLSPYSMAFDFYGFLYVLLNLPLNVLKLLIYAFTNHFWSIYWGNLQADILYLIVKNWSSYSKELPTDKFDSYHSAEVFFKKHLLFNLSFYIKSTLYYLYFKFLSYSAMIMAFTNSLMGIIFSLKQIAQTSPSFYDFLYNNLFELINSFFSFFTQKLNKTLSFFATSTFFGTKTDNVFIYFQNFYFNASKLAYLHSITISKIKYLFKANPLKHKIFKSQTHKENSVDFLMENSNESRNLRFNNPIFKYDYKSGDYFPKLYKEAYAFLIPSTLSLTSGLRTSPWFLSNTVFEIFENSLDLFVNNFHKTEVYSTFEIKPFAINKITNSEAFYNYFLSIENSNFFLNSNWVSNSSLNMKFSKLFLTSSMQQRIYSNWRQLKFTREAWRCKLLATRHQKTLFKRYMSEDGVFWSIERNAKDLIPGWAMITPFSSRTRYTAIGKTDIGLMGVLLVLNSSIISGANFLVTYRYLSTLNNRKMRDARAFFTEAVMVASWMMVLANPMLVIGIVMLLSDRHWQTSFFDYSGGGDTVLFQHMFWFFGHPEVYIIIIPTFGFTNTMLSYYLKKRVSARASLLYSLYTIAFLGFFVWGHHMYMVGLSHTTRMLFSTLTVMISVPAATKIMHWCVTTANSAFAMELPLLFTFTFIFFFVSGGISGMCVAHTGMDVLFHDTFYVIGHFHVMLAGGAMFASFGAFYFYFPAIFGVKYSRVYAYLHYTYYLIGQLMTVAPMFWLGYAGMPRRVLDYPAAFGGWHSVISAGHMLNVAGLMAFFIMIFDSLRQSRAATRNNFGIGRYNVRLNFYLYEIARLNYLQQKTLTLFRFITIKSIKLNNHNFINYEPYESILFSYVFIKADEFPIIDSERKHW